MADYTWQDYPGMTALARRIGDMVDPVKLNPASISVLSTGERIAVALVLDKPEMFPKGDYTILQAVDRLGAEWLEAAILVQKAMDAE